MDSNNNDQNYTLSTNYDYSKSVGTFENFRDALGYRESLNNYKCKNAFGYLGKYQFGKERLYDLGYSLNGYAPQGQPMKIFLSAGDFLEDPDLQETLFIRHVYLLKFEINKKFSGFLNKDFDFVDAANGRRTVPVTLSGLVAGAHLKGIGGVSRFLLTHKDNYDGLHTAFSSYVSKFNGYKI